MEQENQLMEDAYLKAVEDLKALAQKYDSSIREAILSLENRIREVKDDVIGEPDFLLTSKILIREYPDMKPFLNGQ